MTPTIKKEYEQPQTYERQRPLIDPISKYPLDDSTSHNRYERPISSHYYDPQQREKEELLKKYSDYNKPPLKAEEE